LGVLISAVLVTSYISNIIVSFEAMIVFNFFFTEPLFTLHAYDAEYPVTFVVMLIVSFISTYIAAGLKAIAMQSDETYERTKLLFDTATQLHKLSDYDEILSTTGSQLAKLMDKPVYLYDMSRGPETSLLFYPGETFPEEIPTNIKWLSPVKWVNRNNREAGIGTDMFPANEMRFLPVSSHDHVYAVFGYNPEDPDRKKGENIQLNPFDRELIVSILGECSMALERERIQREKEEEVLRRRNEKLRADLLRSISHDLRTPLTSISGNASNLLYLGDDFDDETRKRLYSDIYDDSVWLISLVENLLAVSRIEDGTMQLHRKLELLDDIISEALMHIDRRASQYTILAEPSDETLLVDVDGRLIVQVLINLINNAIQYTPPGSVIQIGSVNMGDCVKVTVSDDGPGIPDSEKDSVFTMFYSGSQKVKDSKRSLGLGLALCRSIVRAHGCEIMLDDNMPHGCRFSFTLPVKEVTLHE
jgi:two-component system sensor histidine kinase KdpD